MKPAQQRDALAERTRTFLGHVILGDDLTVQSVELRIVKRLQTSAASSEEHAAEP